MTRYKRSKLALKSLNYLVIRYLYTMQEIIEQIKQITGVDEIFTAGSQTLVITLNIEPK
jgi:hypothetical protein